jgi:hypothetical protein
MTLELLRKEIWQQTGEPSDLDPDTDIQYSSGPLLNFVVNEAQREIAVWKDKVSGRILRLRNLVDELYFKSTYATATLDSTGTTSTVVFPATWTLNGTASTSVGSNDDQYNRWVVQVGSEVRRIVDYTGSTRTATVHDDWTTAPAVSDTLVVYKDFFLLVPSSHAWSGEHIILPSESDRYRSSGNLLDILRVSDMNSQVDLERMDRTQTNIANVTSTGDPTEFRRFGNRLVFNRAPSESKWFKLEYYRLPTSLSATTDEPEIPEMFHYAIVLWGMRWGFSRQQAPTEAWSVGQRFDDFMRRTVSTYEIEYEREYDFGSLGRE